MVILSLTISLTACGTSKFQKILNNTYQKRVEATNVDKAIEQGRKAAQDAAQIPDQPVTCNVRILANLKRTDSWKVAAHKLAIALEKANNRLQSCYSRNQKIADDRKPKVPRQQ